MSHNNSPNVYKPTERADVDRKSSADPQQRPRKHSDGTKLRLKNAYGIFEYDVTIVSAKYDGAAHTWMYTLKDYDLKPIAKQYPETDLDC